MAQGATQTSNVFIPQVLADMVSAQLEAKLKFTPLAEVDTTLAGRPGDTITVPKWAYIGPAVDVAEMAEIPTDQLTHSTTTMTIKKAAKGVEISDEALTRGYGKPQEEAIKQLATSIADKVDADILTAAKAVTKLTAGGATKAIADAVEAGVLAFNEEDFDSQTVLLVSPKGHAALRKSALFDNTNLKGELLTTGVVGKFLGVDVVLSRRLADGEAFLVKKGAFKLIEKRGVLIETERRAKTKSTAIYADKHYGVYVADDTKIVKITHKKMAGD